MIIAGVSAAIGLSTAAIGIMTGGTVVAKGIDAINEQKTNEHNLNMQKEKDRSEEEKLRITGENERTIAKLRMDIELNNLNANYAHGEEMQRIMNANEEKKIALNNERAKDIDNHKKDIKIAENQHAE